MPGSPTPAHLWASQSPMAILPPHPRALQKHIQWLSFSHHSLWTPRMVELRAERLLGERTPEHFSGALVSQGKLGTLDCTCLGGSSSLNPGKTENVPWHPPPGSSSVSSCPQSLSSHSAGLRLSLLTGLLTLGFYRSNF